MAESKAPTNEKIAAMLEEIAELLDNQESNPYRVQAFYNGAESIRKTNQPVADLARRGDEEGLKDLPGIGEGLATVIFEYVATGRVEYLEDLRKQQPEIARETSTQEKQANKDARKNKDSAKKPSSQPSIATLLEIDAEYRQKASAGELPKLAPRRNNPQNEAWLPILKGKRGSWRYTALFSNTDTAHEAGKTRDWVVIYYDRGQGEDQVTVVTEWRGALEGKRVVRGREKESAAYYEKEK